ncbi:flagellar basal body-associated protein FliL [Vibrio sp. SCSIO 43137]|uniref:flagellar basal body-associated protein FliL n=1 Tax=Vibrio sp. SCSIO 43137 TaxID=3021011 RepID=UPI002307F84D|nr:flagellar basal body-associated protein FliL [Vibrio sp. SCSIO 43137]WCE29617.1 flagellar basal body-associated protein FliL [Vibrio sp. SCSIO 43137]
MLTRYLLLFTFICTSLFSVTSLANEEADQGPAFAYYTLEPDMTTNIYTKGKTLSYLQVRIDLMVADNSYIVDLEQHDPLIRNTIVEIIGQQSSDQVKSLAGREELRKKLLDELNSLLLVETGRTLIADLLFTKYLYQ